MALVLRYFVDFLKKYYFLNFVYLSHLFKVCKMIYNLVEIKTEFVIPFFPRFLFHYYVSNLIVTKKKTSVKISRKIY